MLPERKHLRKWQRYEVPVFSLEVKFNVLELSILLILSQRSITFQWVEMVTKSRKEKPTNDENNPNNANENEGYIFLK